MQRTIERDFDRLIAPPYDPILDQQEATSHCVMWCLSGQISTDELGREAYQIIEESNLDAELFDCPESVAELIALAINNRSDAPMATAIITRAAKKLTREL